MGGSGLDRPDDFQKFADQDWIGFILSDQDLTRTEKCHSPLISAFWYTRFCSWSQSQNKICYHLLLL